MQTFLRLYSGLGVDFINQVTRRSSLLNWNSPRGHSSSVAVLIAGYSSTAYVALNAFNGQNYSCKLVFKIDLCGPGSFNCFGSCPESLEFGKVVCSMALVVL